MTAPRQVLPGATYLLTRRCAQREFLLRPSDTVNELFPFVLAVAARRSGVLVHAYCVMSNHIHLVVTDPDARLPEFHQYLAAIVARAMNAALGRWESFWAPGSYSAVRLLSPEDIVNEVAYTLANPVKAGLVRTGRMWPGLWSDPDRFGTALEVRRPKHFFSPRTKVADSEVLDLAVPPGFASAADFRDRVEAALRAKEAEAHERVSGKFAGVARVLKQNPTSRPESFAPRRTLRPRIAAKDPRQRIEALEHLKHFVREYRAAWADRRAGVAGVVFPAGTYLLRVAHGVPCACFG